MLLINNIYLTSPPFYHKMNPYMSKPTQDKNQELPIEVLKELLTPSEVRMLKNRWQIILALEEGLSIRRIASQVKVGTDTVVRTARMTERSSLRKLIDSKKNKKGFKTNTPWIFGSSK